MEKTMSKNDKLMSYGINTNLENSPTLNLGYDTKENYHQLLRVLKRLTKDYTPTANFMRKLFSNFTTWRSEFTFDSKSYYPLTKEDTMELAKAFEFKKRKIKPLAYALNTDTLMVVYNGPAYRQRRVYMGQMNSKLELTTGAQVRNVIFISKETAVFLNWLSDHYPVNERITQDWSNIYRSASDNSYYGVFVQFMVDKLNNINASHHKVPLDRIFKRFYFDYNMSYSGVLQKRTDKKAKSNSIATAYLTKKNIPDDIKRLMNNTKLLKLFEYVEFDEDVKEKDIIKFENDVLYFKDDPLFNLSVKSLRIRKLGKHSSETKTTKGLYYPSLDNISLDLRSLESFVHEWGHALDYHKGRPSINDKVFLDKIHTHAVNSLHSNNKLNINSRHYYTIPSEVFARAFEWYIFDKYNVKDNTALYSKKRYTKNIEFKIYQEIDDIIRDYFNKLETNNRKEPNHEQIKRGKRVLL